MGVMWKMLAACALGMQTIVHYFQYGLGKNKK